MSTLYEKKYAWDIVHHLNRRPAVGRTSVFEIGCGLGDIIRRLRFSRRIGYDMDRPALQAARFLSRFRPNGKIDFDWFEFPQTPLAGQADSVIMVNWIHHVPPSVLRMKIENYFDQNLLPGGEIIIDTVQDKAYKHNHDIAFLTAGIPATISRIGQYERQREIWSIKKAK
jgi:SAM-dependent methyltransferase